jgi:Chlorite dismutase
VSPPASPPRLAARIWGTFAFTAPGAASPAPAAGEAAAVDRYRVEAVVPVRGAPIPELAPGWMMTRLESRTPTPALANTFAFTGSTQHLLYTSGEQQSELARVSKQSPSPIVVLIPITKSEAWWGLPHDQRLAHFHSAQAGARGHTAIGAAFADRIFRRLYHARYLPGASWDFFTYFEMEPGHVDDFKRLLMELRDPALNPEWDFVEREVELWMRRLPSA